MEFRTYGATSSNENSKLLSKSDHSYDQGNRKLLGIEKPSFYFSFYVLFYVVFLCLGAITFTFLETPVEIGTRMQLDNYVSNFKKLHPNVSEEALEELIEEVVKASRKGISVTFNGTHVHNWNFAQSIFFASSVVTTIGYGQVTPLSRSGKIFCILYAIVGIPLTLVLLSGLVERFLVPAIELLRWLNFKTQHLYEPFSIRLLHLAIIVTVLVIFALFLPAVAFYYMEEEWTYLDAFYYCFISLTTIGLGDYIPGTSNRPNPIYQSLYKIITTVYLFLGITFMMLTLAIFYDIPQLNLGLLFSLSRDIFPRRRTQI